MIAPQAIYTVVFVKTPSYVEGNPFFIHIFFIKLIKSAVYGLFDFSVHLSALNILRDINNGDTDHIDAQLDPRGTDGGGNPIGGLMFSNAFDSSNGQYAQAAEWFRLAIALPSSLLHLSF